MGCCSSQSHYSNLSADLQSKCTEVLLYLKAITMRLIEIDEYAMAIKVIHIRNITKGYYSEVNSQRANSLKNLGILSDQESEEFEKTIASEKEILKKAIKSVKRNFHSICNGYFFVPPQADDFIFKFMNRESKMTDYEELKDKYSRYQKNGKGVDYISKVLNNNKNFSRKDTKFLKSICEFTTHVASNKRKRTSYLHFGIDNKVRKNISSFHSSHRRLLILRNTEIIRRNRTDDAANCRKSFHSQTKNCVF